MTSIKHCSSSSVRVAAHGLAFALVALLPGCALDMQDSGEGVGPAEENSGQLDQAIRGGSAVTDYSAAVYLRTFACSGALIAQDAILTSAHCVSDIANGSFVNVKAEIMKGGLRRCITDSSTSGACSGSLSMKVMWDPNFTGGLDTADDIAVLWRANGFYKISTIDPSQMFFGLYTGSLEYSKNFDVYGWGDNSYTGTGEGTLRFGQKILEPGYTGYHFFNDVSNAELYQICTGDSGSPAVAREVNFPGHRNLLQGLTSNFSSSSSRGICSRPGDRERWQRVSGKITFIENSIGRTCPSINAKHVNGATVTYRWCVKPM